MFVNKLKLFISGLSDEMYNNLKINNNVLLMLRVWLQRNILQQTGIEGPCKNAQKRKKTSMVSWLVYSNYFYSEHCEQTFEHISTWKKHN